MFPFSTLEKLVKIPVSGYPYDPKTIGEHIRKRRLDLKLVQSEVSKLFGTTAAVLSIWELGHRKPQMNYLPKIIKFLGYNPLNRSNGLLSEKILNFRITHGLSQFEFSKICKVNQSTITHWERGSKPHKKLLKKLKAVLKG